MKLITLNTWGGQIFEPLMRFVEQHATEADIFCFQEMLFGDSPDFTPVYRARLNLYIEVAKKLAGFTGFQHRASEAEYFPNEPLKGIVGQAIFVRDGLGVKAHGGFQACRDLPGNTAFGGKVTGRCQWVEFEDNSIVLNVHGLWQ